MTVNRRGTVHNDEQLIQAYVLGGGQVLIQAAVQPIGGLGAHLGDQPGQGAHPGQHDAMAAQASPPRRRTAREDHLRR